ncbi:sulfite exporter TauE/SafE family protein [Neptunomonas phycophila]|uniref:sulfite exporter TauE/SafE family protein n=1 Tax=Neptunomonas phycophila TaxID=1572645 RepID=UPI0026E28B89|nr:sulfite exporter TauE/SafE family protein [Neptunomonas phycophila]MDO6782615.1 sulfite exporter TauE/SafE family protein [Neptunomonas phycophila]
MITDPFFYAVAIPAVLITAISKGGFGGGLGLIAVPMMALVIAPQQAAAIQLPILCLMDIVGIWKFKGSVNRSLLLQLLPAAGIGIVLGALTFKYLTADHIRIIVGGISLLFALNFWFKSQNRPAKKPNKVAGSLWGALAGFTSFGIHAGGAPLNAYLLPLRLPRAEYAGTTIIFFTAINFTKLVPYTMLGQFTAETLKTSLALAVLAPIGVLMGVAIHKRIDDVWFYKVCYSFLLLMGIKLLYDAFT